LLAETELQIVVYHSYPVRRQSLKRAAKPKMRRNRSAFDFILQQRLFLKHVFRRKGKLNLQIVMVPRRVVEKLRDFSAVLQVPKQLKTMFYQLFPLISASRGKSKPIPLVPSGFRIALTNEASIRDAAL
jgi:hypothetical protein